MNNLFLIGRLTNEPELKETQNKKYTRITLAVDRHISKEDKAAGKQSVDFINMTLWENTAINVSKYCHKGSLVAVNGKLSTGSYTAQDGTRKYTMDVRVTQFVFLDSRKKEESKTEPVQEQTSIYTENMITDDDLPF